MNWIKKILPNWLKQILIKVILLSNEYFSLLFLSGKGLASLYYFLFNWKFGREHKAVLTGRRAYRKNLKVTGESSVLMRRNIHRIEKALIMRPRRDTFAEDYIIETVRAYFLACESGVLDNEEMKWSRDVLEKYFSVIKDTKIIKKARVIYKSASSVPESTDKKYIPYEHKSLGTINVSYGDLHGLFIKRRSVRWYQEKEVPVHLIEKAVDIAVLAPSACNRQPYSFYVTSSGESAINVAKCAGGTAGWAENIPCIIAVVGDLSFYSSESDRHIIYIDASLAAMQLMLALETLGLSSCSINWPDIESKEKKIRKILGIKYFERVIMLLAVGYAESNGGIPYSQKKNSKLMLKKI